MLNGRQARTRTISFAVCKSTMLTKELELGLISAAHCQYRVNSQPPETDHAPNSQVVTECWVERCLKERRVCSPDDSVVFRPLTKPMPIQGGREWSSRCLRDADG